MMLYICPALMDWMIYFVSTEFFYSQGARGAALWECALVGIAFQGFYFLASLGFGHILNVKNSGGILFMSSVFCGILSICCLYSESLMSLSIISCLLGMAMAGFFNAFQTFMRGESEVGGLRRTVANYAFSWSLGAGVGCLSFGILYSQGRLAMSIAIAIVTLFVCAFLKIYRRRDTQTPSADEHVEDGPPGSRPVSPTYIIIGWIMIFTVVFVQRPAFTFLPAIFAKGDESSIASSLPLFGHMLMQAIVAFSVIRFRHLLYRRTPFWIIQALGALAFLAIWLHPGYLTCLMMLMALGIYSGFVYYSVVYYSSNSGRRSFNIGVNEALVGSGSVIGIIVGDYGAKLSNTGFDIFLVCSIALGVSMAAQVIIATFSGKKPVQ